MTTTLLDLSSQAAVHDVRLPLVFVVEDPISHGAGTAGNTQLLRTQDVILPDGRRTAVPYVSGNSLRHRLRDALAWHLVRALDVPAGSLAKRVVDLLWSGGALTSTGNQAELGMIREADRVLPALGALGYSARSDIVAGTVWVDNIHLVCVENVWRLPAHLAGHPHAAGPAGVYRGEAFGTRHDVAAGAAGRFVGLMTGDGMLDGGPSPVDTTQMIYDLQTIKPGSVLFGGLWAQAPTAGHVAALATAIDTAAPLVAGRRTITLGGKGATGFGRCHLDVDLTGLDATIGDLRAAYEAHLAAHRDRILDLLAEVVGQ